MRDRSTLVDLLLAFAAIFVITLALWPKAPALQVVRCKTVNEGWKTYSIAVDDPSLVDLKSLVQRWGTPEFDPQYVTAKWQKEVAEFYERSEPVQDAKPSQSETVEPEETVGPATAMLSDTVTFASYEQPIGQGVAHDHSVSQCDCSNESLAVPSLEAVPSIENGDARPLTRHGSLELTDDKLMHGESAVRPVAYVESVELESPKLESPAGTSETDSVDSSLASPSDINYWATVKASAEATMDAAKIRSSEVPVVFAGIKPSPWPQLAFHLAFLFGIVAACAYMHWLRYAPLAREVEFKNQSAGVMARLGTFAGLVLFAMFSSIAVWV